MPCTPSEENDRLPCLSMGYPGCPKSLWMLFNRVARNARSNEYTYRTEI